MTASTKRSILRGIHMVLAIPLAGYVYSPFENIPDYAGPTRYVFFPLSATGPDGTVDVEGAGASTTVFEKLGLK